MRLIRIASKNEIEVALTMHDLDVLDRALNNYVSLEQQEVFGSVVTDEHEPSSMHVIDMSLFIRGLMIILAEYDQKKDKQAGDNGHKDGGSDDKPH